MSQPCGFSLVWRMLWIVKNKRERVCYGKRQKSVKILLSELCRVNYPCPWWFMASFDVHIGVPYNLYTPFNYEGPIWPANLSSTQLLLAKEGFVCQIYLSCQNSRVSLLRQWTKWKWDPVNVFVPSFHQSSTVFQKSIMFLSERGKEREIYSNLAPVQTYVLLFL